jgi:hypothetical protein
LLEIDQSLQIFDLWYSVFAKEKRANTADSFQVLNFFDFVGAELKHLQFWKVQILYLNVSVGTFLILLLRRNSLRSRLRWLMLSIFFMLL